MKLFMCISILATAAASKETLLNCGDSVSVSTLSREEDERFVIKSHADFDGVQTTYANQVTCSYTIQVGDACGNMSMTCDAFSLLGFMNHFCAGSDYLEFHNNDDIRSNNGKFCGNCGNPNLCEPDKMSLPAFSTSSKNPMTILFHTDGKDVSTGFRCFIGCNNFTGPSETTTFRPITTTSLATTTVPCSETNCVFDHSCCHSNLSLSIQLAAEFTNPYYIGSSDYFTLLFSVTNSNGDPSYNPKVQMPVPGGVRAYDRPEECKSTEDLIFFIICELHGPLKAGMMSVLSINFTWFRDSDFNETHLLVNDGNTTGNLIFDYVNTVDQYGHEIDGMDNQVNNFTLQLKKKEPVF